MLGFRGSVGARTHAIAIFDTATHKQLQYLSLVGPETALGDLAFTKDGTHLIAGTGRLSVWETSGWTQIRQIAGPFSRGAFASGGVRSIAVSPDGRSVAVLYDDVVFSETVHIDSLDALNEIARRAAKTKQNFAQYLKDVAADVLPRSLQCLKAFDIESGEEKYSIRVPDASLSLSSRYSTNVSYSVDGRYLILGRADEHPGADGTAKRHHTAIEIRAADTGKPLREISDPHVMAMTAVAVSPEGARIATATETLAKESILNPSSGVWTTLDNKDPIRIWDLESGRLVSELGGLRGAPRALSFSSDGKRLVSCQADVSQRETVWVWDVESGRNTARGRTTKSGTECLSVAAIGSATMSIVAPVLDTLYFFTVSATEPSKR